MTTTPEANKMEDCEAARRVAAVCRLPEAAQVRECVEAAVTRSSRADVLWLTWVQWRAWGREAMIRETELSLWTITSRLSQLRQAGVPVLSWSEETDRLARGQFHEAWT